MKKLDDHSQWENEWAAAFENARLTPPPSVWNNIQAVQADKQADKYKKRIVFYKWLAAASVFFSICSAAFLLLNSNEAGYTEMASNKTASEKVPVVTEAPLQENSTGNSLFVEEPSQGQDQKGKPGLQVAGESGINGNSKSSERSGSFAKEERAKNSSSSVIASLAKEDEHSIEEKGLPIKEKETASIVSVGKEKREQEQSFAATQEGQGSTTVAGAGVAAKEAEADSHKPKVNIGEEVAEGLALNTQQEEVIPGGEGAGLFVDGDETVGASSGTSSGGVPVFFVERKELLALEFQQDSIVAAEIRKVWVASNFFKEKKEKSTPRFMLGASLTSNSFNANYLDNSPEVALMAANLDNIKPAKGSTLSTARITDWDEEQQSVMSVAGALQGAAWISKRWIVQGGLQYGNYKTSGTASTFTDPQENISYPLHFANYSPDKVEAASFRGRSSSTVNATNTFEFLSVPLSIGYVVLDRKISLLLSPGISSEFFLSNQLKAEEANNLDAFTVPNGEESPFNFVHFRGLISAQLFYKMSDNYLISLEPGYQHAITDFNKSDTFFNSRPSNISIAAGFRYIFH